MSFKRAGKDLRFRKITLTTRTKIGLRDVQV